MNYSSQYQIYQTQIERALTEYFSQERNIVSPLREAMQYSIAAGGKRLRPVLMLACFELFKPLEEKVMPFACAIEMIHTYSLIHDDLPAMDDDDLRRGKPTNHKIFGEGMAILAGDGLLSYAIEIMLDDIKARGYAENAVDAMRAIVHGAGAFGMVAGQCVDLSAEETQADYESLQFIHKHKTGDMITAACLAGGILAGADDIQSLKDYGDALGLAFQITDDILDVVGDSSVLGKSTGKDEAGNKATYPLLFGLEKSKAMAKEQIGKACNAIACLKNEGEFLRLLAYEIINRCK